MKGIEVARQVVGKLRSQGFEAYLVGGCVRDMLMRKSSKDFDIATDAKVAQIEKVFAHKTYPLGAKFGTVLLIKQQTHFQISTFRNEKGNNSPELSDDLKARDFTINALAYDPIKKKTIDLLDAKQDLRKKRIRSKGKLTEKFRQDPLRLIRAVRFAVSLRFNIEQKTLQAITRLARLITRVSKERVREELISIFTSADPARGLSLLEQTTLLNYVLPEVAKLKGVRQPEAFHPEGDVFAHTLLMLKKLNRPSLVLVFACLFHDIGKPQTFQITDRIRFSGHDKVGARLSDKIMRRLKFSNQDRENVCACVDNHMRMMTAPKMRESTLKRLLCRPTFAEELRLHQIDCIASHRNLEVFRFLTKQYNQFKRRPIIPKPILSGYDLIKIGFTPGPIFGKIQRQMVNLQLEGKLKSRSQARKWVIKKWLK